MTSPQSCLDGIHDLSLLIPQSLPSGPGAQRQSVRSRALLGCMKELQQATELLFGSEDGSGGGDYRMAADVLEGVRSVLRKLGISLDSPSTSRTREQDDFSGAPSWLQSILKTMRAIEPTFAFQQQLHGDKQLTARRHKCSVEQLTYGTTSWAFFRRVLQSAEVARAMRAESGPTSTNKRCAVFGSSTGMLAFYVSACYPHAYVDGYEVLPCLVALADSLRDSYYNTSSSSRTRSTSASTDSDGQGRIAFHLKDMLSADISQCSLIVLASLCFDKRTRRALYAKLSEECPRECVVVDYQDAFKEFGLEARGGRYGMGVGTGLFTSPRQLKLEGAVNRCSVGALRGALEAVLEAYESQLLQGPSARAKCKFALTAVLEGEVNWSAAQKIFVFRAEI